MCTSVYCTRLTSQAERCAIFRSMRDGIHQEYQSKKVYFLLIQGGTARKPTLINFACWFRLATVATIATIEKTGLCCMFFSLRRLTRRLSRTCMKSRHQPEAERELFVGEAHGSPIYRCGLIFKNACLATQAPQFSAAYPVVRVRRL